MKKIYVLDTSALAGTNNLLSQYKQSELVLPVGILLELDKLKTFPGEVGGRSRQVIRTLDELSVTGDLSIGIKLGSNTVKIENKDYWNETFGDYSYIDNRILSTAAQYKKKFKTAKVVIVTEDVSLRLRARTLGLLAECCPNTSKDRISDLYTGHQEMLLSAESAAQLRVDSFISCKNQKEFTKIKQNEFIHFIDSEGGGLGIVRRVGDRLKLVKSHKVYGIDALNKEQAMALELLMDPEVPLVSLVGLAGSGKTLIAMAAGLEMVTGAKKKYKQLVMYRPMEPVGREIGFTPGSIQEKLQPWMGPLYDSLDLLLNKGNDAPARFQSTLGLMMEKGWLKFEALTYVRGRSINDSFVLIDESQNLNREEIKTILTRVGHNTKIVLTGDIEQIDSKNLDALNNGLTYAVESFKDSGLSGHVTLQKGERSKLATLAAEIL